VGTALREIVVWQITARQESDKANRATLNVRASWGAAVLRPYMMVPVIRRLLCRG
jgi:hypothetical protein